MSDTIHQQVALELTGCLTVEHQIGERAVFSTEKAATILCRNYGDLQRKHDDLQKKFEGERDGYDYQIADLEVKLVAARKYIEKHPHTEECFRYAAKTAARGSGAHCIAQCADSRRKTREEISGV